MFRFLSVFLVLSLAALAADELPLAAPESVGMSSKRLDRIGPWLDGFIEREEAAGFVTLVARRGKVVHHEAHGARGLSAADPMPKEAIFGLASMGKPFTVVAALMLLEEGRFALHDPISKYLPEFQDLGVRIGEKSIAPADREITVQSLFTHTSGIGATWPRGRRTGFPSMKAYMQELAKAPLLDQPSTTWHYDYSHDVPAYLVETVGEKPFAEFVQQRIFDALGMEDTHFWLPASKQRRRAVRVVDGEDLAPPPLGSAERGPLAASSGGEYSTATDSGASARCC